MQKTISRPVPWLEKGGQKKGFRHGYIFGEIINDEIRDSPRCLASNIERQQKRGWSVNSTRINQYGLGYIKGFGAYLIQLADEKQAAGKRLAILELGAGSSSTSTTGWSNVISHPGVDFSATSLTSGYVHLSMEPYIRVSDAANLHKIFPPESFDIITAYHGTHDQEMQAFENIFYLLKIGGQAFVSGDVSSCFPIPKLPKSTLPFELNYEAQDSVKKYWSYWHYWIRKTGNHATQERE